ncbi:MAG TPA: SRPBCC family protein [Bacteroidia bacterium]|nr:SRPBCC family protein [Bacteroidia bacterium]
MKILKNIVLILVFLIVALVIVGLLMPSSRHMERSVNVSAKPETVFSYVNDLKKWNSWSPWFKMDPNSKMVFSEPAAGSGANYTWDSENANVGKGKLTIEESIPSELVKTKIEFEGMEDSHAYFKLEPEGESTKVTWAFDSNMGNNPFFRLMGLMMDKMMGKIFEDGLADLKKVSEATLIPPVEETLPVQTDSLK